MVRSRRKDRKIDIVIGLPSYNEEDNIENVVQVVDRGLQKFFAGYQSLILNIDSESEDNTVGVFNQVKTNTLRKSISGGKYPRGKGANLFVLLKFAIDYNIPWIVTVDSDIKSIKPNWIFKLLSPVISGSFDYVTPLYLRNRYEGSTTNHFCFPIIKSVFMADVRQPIGGEFALSLPLAQHIMKQRKPPLSYQYGIDIFFTMNALSGGFKIKEVYLGQKVHKPSFDKMISMFQQVAATLFYLLFKSGKRNQLRPKVICEEVGYKRAGIAKESNKPNEARIRVRMDYIQSNLAQLLESKISYKPLDQALLKKLHIEKMVSMNLWRQVLKLFIQYLRESKRNRKEINRLTDLITPIFLLRVLTFYNEINGKSSKEIENIIEKQARFSV